MPVVSASGNFWVSSEVAAIGSSGVSFTLTLTLLLLKTRMIAAVTIKGAITHAYGTRTCIVRKCVV